MDFVSLVYAVLRSRKKADMFKKSLVLKPYIKANNGTFLALKVETRFEAQPTVVFTVMEIWLKILGVFGTKTCHMIRKNIAKNGPLEFRTVLWSNLCQMLVFDERN